MPGSQAFAPRSRVRSCAQVWTSLGTRRPLGGPGWYDRRSDWYSSASPVRQRRGEDTLAEQPGDLGHVWNRVIADLSGSSPQSGAATLSSQQRAFLRLTRPLGLIDGTALLAAPSEFAKDAIERILRLPISEALGRHLGVAVTLAVVVDASAASGGSEVPDPPGAVRTDLSDQQSAIGSHGAP